MSNRVHHQSFLFLWLAIILSILNIIQVEAAYYLPGVTPHSFQTSEGVRNYNLKLYIKLLRPKAPATKINKIKEISKKYLTTTFLFALFI